MSPPEIVAAPRSRLRIGLGAGVLLVLVGLAVAIVVTATGSHEANAQAPSDTASASAAARAARRDTGPDIGRRGGGGPAVTGDPDGWARAWGGSGAAGLRT